MSAKTLKCMGIQGTGSTGAHHGASRKYAFLLPQIKSFPFLSKVVSGFLADLGSACCAAFPEGAAQALCRSR